MQGHVADLSRTVDFLDSRIMGTIFADVAACKTQLQGGHLVLIEGHEVIFSEKVTGFATHAAIVNGPSVNA